MAESRPPKPTGRLAAKYARPREKAGEYEYKYGYGETVYALRTGQQLKHQAVTETLRLIGYNAGGGLTGLAYAYGGAYAGKYSRKCNAETREEYAEFV